MTSVLLFVCVCVLLFWYKLLHTFFSCCPTWYIPSSLPLSPQKKKEHGSKGTINELNKCAFGAWRSLTPASIFTTCSMSYRVIFMILYLYLLHEGTLVNVAARCDRPGGPIEENKRTYACRRKQASIAGFCSTYVRQNDS